jgi:hypothetical protein
VSAIKLQSIQGFWAQLQAQALTARDIFVASSLTRDALVGEQQTTGLRSVAEIIEECRINGVSISEVSSTASVDMFLMHSGGSPTSFAGSELVGCAFRCDSTETVA